jgi:hypothetical protein
VRNILQGGDSPMMVGRRFVISRHRASLRLPVIPARPIRGDTIEWCLRLAAYLASAREPRARGDGGGERDATRVIAAVCHVRVNSRNFLYCGFGCRHRPIARYAGASGWRMVSAVPGTNLDYDCDHLWQSLGLDGLQFQEDASRSSLV